MSRLEIPEVLGRGYKVTAILVEEDKRDGEPLDRGSGLRPESRQVVRRAGLDRRQRGWEGGRRDWMRAEEQ